jgi:hypothetical protein
MLLRKAQGLGRAPFVKGTHPAASKSRGNSSQEHILRSSRRVLQTVEFATSFPVPRRRLLWIGTDDDNNRCLGNKLLSIGRQSQVSLHLWIPHHVKVPWLPITGRRCSNRSL